MIEETAKEALERQTEQLRDEVLNFRKTYGLTQVEMAKALGKGESTIQRYESASSIKSLKKYQRLQREFADRNAKIKQEFASKAHTWVDQVGEPHANPTQWDMWVNEPLSTGEVRVRIWTGTKWHELWIAKGDM